MQLFLPQSERWIKGQVRKTPQKIKTFFLKTPGSVSALISIHLFRGQRQTDVYRGAPVQKIIQSVSRSSFIECRIISLHIQHSVYAFYASLNGLIRFINRQLQRFCRKNKRKNNLTNIYIHALTLTYILNI